MVEKELLWEAWPDGYLAMRGVLTQGGLQCVGFTSGSSAWMKGLKTGGEILHVPFRLDISVGTWLEHCKGLSPDALLPQVDPSDTATWSCLLVDLARSLPDNLNPLGGLDPESGLTWVESGESHWVLSDVNRVAPRYFSGIPTEDPAEALVLARIQSRSLW